MYRVRPKLDVVHSMDIYEGYEEVLAKLSSEFENNNVTKVAFESYPSLNIDKFIDLLKAEWPELLIINTKELYLSPERIFTEIQDDLSEDEVFGRFSQKKFTDFLNPEKISNFYKHIMDKERILLVGVAASQIIDYDFLVYLDINRWEIQKNYKAGANNWQAYKETEFTEKLKRAYYFEWPAATEIKERELKNVDFYIDYNLPELPKMIAGDDLIESLKEIVSKPIRLVPFFEPGIWGGHWMQEQFKVGEDEVNLAWCFDGVPEENSIILQTNSKEIELPAQNLSLLFPKELLGNKVYGQYGKDFPIRFNLLDTMGGQNLSLQVHPTLDYAYREFRAKYTQDESYYVLATQGDAKVYLGVKDHVDRDTLVREFEKSRLTGEFNDEEFIHSLPVSKHDHYLIPGGTIHSSGSGSVVLEISSTPNRFTFKLWDWGRVDLDGKPRPISLHHGQHVINTDINESFVLDELYNQFNIIEEGENYKIERTGLHELEAIETERMTFTHRVRVETSKSVNVLNLVEGEHIQVVSIDESFKPFDVYYGETFIIPEQIGEYYLKNMNQNNEVKVIKAYIR